MRDTEPEVPRRALPQAEETRRRRALHQELAVRAGVALLMLAFNELFTMVPAAKGMIRLAASLGFLVNLPYYVAARAGRLRRLQAWIRMVMDVALITAGLYAAGGLAAAPYLGIYAIVPVYGGIVFSSRACLVITQLATFAYLAMAGAQRFGLLPFTSPPHPDAWEVAVFNLLVLNIVGGLAAVLADAFRRNRHRLAAAYGELERARSVAADARTDRARGPALRGQRGRGRRHARDAQRAPERVRSPLARAPQACRCRSGRRRAPGAGGRLVRARHAHHPHDARHGATARGYGRAAPRRRGGGAGDRAQSLRPAPRRHHADRGGAR